MKSFIFISLTLITLFFVPQVLAQTATPSARPTPKRETIKATIAARKAEQQVKLSAIRKERIINFSNKMVIRLEATIERLEKLIDRIESRITKIEEGNSDIDVEPIKESLDEAKEKLASVKVELTVLKENLDEVPDAVDPKSAFEEAREALKAVKEGLKDVHGMLVKLIGDIKGLRVGESKQ